MDIFPLLVVLLSCKIEAAGAQMKLSPLSLTVLRGKEANFTCSPSNSKWTVMVWMLNGVAALTISNESGLLPTINPNVTAVKAKDNKSWVFVLKNTERDNQGSVTCDLQGIDRKSADLFVQEKGSVTISVENKLAFKGQSVLFECRAAGWDPKPSLQWRVNDKMVNEAEYNISSEKSGESLFTVTSNLSVTAAKSSHVDCLASVSALTTPLNSSIRLTVVAEVVQEDDDCIFPVALLSSLSALLLLALLCTCTVLCYRQRRQAKANPQETIRFDQSVFGRSPVAEATGGKVNLGYFSEGATDAAYSELIAAMRSQMDFVSFHKVPDVVSSGSLSVHSEGQAQVSQAEESSKNVRMITTV